MKIKKINNIFPDKKLLIALGLVLLLIVSGLIIANITGVFNPQRIKNNELTAQVDKTSAVKPAQSTSNDNSSTLPSKSQANSDTSISSLKSNVPTPSTPPEQPVLSRAEQSTSGDIKVVAVLKQSSPGYCELILSSADSQTIIKEAYIVVSPTYYSCNFSVPRNELNAGQWEAAVVHHIGKASSSSDTNNIEVR